MNRPDPSQASLDYAPPARSRLLSYAWIGLKNVLGWAMMVLAIPSGMVIPGPNGIVLFLLGFALVSFPGKRRVTARVLRGKPIDPRSHAYRLTVAAIALLLPTLLILYLHRNRLVEVPQPHPFPWIAGIVYTVLAGSLLLTGLRAAGLFNWALRVVARGRRAVRPWLRLRGIDLLPPRRRRRHRLPDGRTEGPSEETVIEIHERHVHNLRRWLKASWPWIKRTVGLALVVLIFWRMLKPVVQNWDKPEIHERVTQINWLLFAAAAAMFALTSLVFRVPSWRWILKGLGHPLPYRPASRIWSTSEMVRYIPGLVWQVLGRVYLVRAYGVPASVCSISQILEITIFVLGNVLIALAGLSMAGLGGVDEKYRNGVYVIFALVPLLLLLLHPAVFYGALNWVLRKVKKPEITQKLNKRSLLKIVGWAVIGLLWQSLAIWLLTYSFLKFELSQFWVLAGSYCVAWTAGFCLASVFPAGIGVREAVFVAVASIAMPPAMRQQLSNETVRTALLGFLSVLLRLWTIAGELMVIAVAYVIDFKGAMNCPDAAGRVVPPAGTEVVDEANTNRGVI